MKVQAGVMSVEMNQTSRRDPNLGASDATGTINSSLKVFVDQLISSPTRVALFHNWLFSKSSKTIYGVLLPGVQC